MMVHIHCCVGCRSDTTANESWRVCRAAKTLLYYFYELNPTLYGWLSMYLKEHEIPRDGNWDDVSGETFLREMLMTPIEETRWGKQVVRLFFFLSNLLPWTQL